MCCEKTAKNKKHKIVSNGGKRTCFLFPVSFLVLALEVTAAHECFIFVQL